MQHRDQDVGNPYYTTLAEEISWFLHVNERERVSPCTAPEWRREVEGIVTSVLSRYGIDP